MDPNTPRTAAAPLLSGEAVPRWELEEELGSVTFRGRDVIDTLLRSKALALEVVRNDEGLELLRTAIDPV